MQEKAAQEAAREAEALEERARQLPKAALVGSHVLWKALEKDWLRLGCQLLWVSCEGRRCGVDCRSGLFSDKTGPSIVTKRPGRAIWGPASRVHKLPCRGV